MAGLSEGIDPAPVILMTSSKTSFGVSAFAQLVDNFVVNLAQDADGQIAPTVLIMSLTNLAGAVAYLQVFKHRASRVTVGTTVPDWVFCLNTDESRTIQVPWCLGGSGFEGIDSLASLSIAATDLPHGNGASSIWVQALTVIGM